MLRRLVLAFGLALGLAHGFDAAAQVPTVNTTSTACDGTLSSGAAQLVFANAAGIHGFTIMNVATAAHSMAISWRTTTPAIGQANSYTLVQNGSYTTPDFFAPQGPLYIIGTSGDSWTCDRW